MVNVATSVDINNFQSNTKLLQLNLKLFGLLRSWKPANKSEIISWEHKEGHVRTQRQAAGGFGLRPPGCQWTSSPCR